MQSADIPEAEPAAEEMNDAVAAAVSRVESQLEDLRSKGKLPRLPKGELDRQFQGVVESVEAQLLTARVDAHDVVASSDYLTGGIPDSEVGGSGARRIVVRFLSSWTKFILPRLGRFATATAVAIDQLADRQDHIQNLVVNNQLDRIRSLEYRCAQLELELDRLQPASEPEA